MRTRILLALLGSAVLNGVALAVGRGGFLHVVAVLGCALYVGVPALAVWTCAYALENRFRLAGRIARVAMLVASVSVSTLLSLLPGREMAKRDIATAKAYCDSLISQIEQHHQTRGVYPPDLAPFWRQGDGPHLVRHSLHYWSDGAQYTFTFSDPRGMMNFVSYRSSDRSWAEWH
jgi:hypothetical protein